MSTFPILLIAIIVVLLIFAVVAHSKSVISQRQRYDQGRQIAKEREATVAILGLAQKAISTDISDQAFLSIFVEYAQRSLLATGGAVMISEDDGSLGGCAITGIFPPMKEVTRQVEEQLLAHAKKHTEFFKDLSIPDGIKIFSNFCGDKGYAYFSSDNIPEIFPKRFKKVAPMLALAPVVLKHKTIAFVLVVSRDEFDEHKLSEEDAKYLTRLNEIAAMSIGSIRIFCEKREYEKHVETAREEGMLQVSAGIIHNIGNAITVAKLNVDEMRSKYPDDVESPEQLIIEAMIPEVEKAIRENRIQDFLTKDSSGSQYMIIIRELLSHISARTEDMIRLVRSLKDKLNHISEIIELQQRFVGELGTENMVSLGSVVDSAIKIFEESFNKYGVRIEVNVKESLPEILIDTSMMTQVFMNILKNAVEAMESEKTDKKRFIRIKLEDQEVEGKKFIAAALTDNGPGMSQEVLKKLFEFGFSSKEKHHHSRGYGLHSCNETVKKYGGSIKVDSKLGEGSTFTILLPVREKH